MRPCSHRLETTALAIAASLLTVTSAHANLSNLCERQTEVTAAQQDTLYQFANVVKTALRQSGQEVALVARSGTDLRRFGLRYSHAGVALAKSENAPWSVRQLYYSCDEHQPKVYDQGISGFLLGADNPTLGYLSVVLLPHDASVKLQQTALSKQTALSVLGVAYSANAYAYSVQFQNCNQWLIELLAYAWGDLPPMASLTERRSTAQNWLKAQPYTPTDINLGHRWLLWATAVVPFVHTSDHPQEDLDQLHMHISMPESIEHFVRQRAPEAQRIEFCHADKHVVIHRGWSMVADGCVAGEGDEVIELE